MSSRLGEVAELPQGFTSVEYNGGTLVSADTGLSEIEVGERVLDLWERSGMREVPHPERTILPGEEWSYQLPDGSILG
ncbi:hypothetical protein [Kocuria sp.]|uniref:hypothetical protein n=1 Tax=Kocuria sp. TaxID=1871328 RepID=UPI0026E09358|nr:hypothetical protein [Kocuria sp.]MDO5619464.1 hypothetical protein [Kocuria sp.]